MRSVQIFDKPMCCSTGVCGPQVDPVLPRFAADLDWLRSMGLSVDRFNLAQQPDAFIKNNAVNELLAVKGTDCLPLIFVDGVLVDEANYPTRDAFVKWTGLIPKFPSLSIVSDVEACDQPGCC